MSEKMCIKRDSISDAVSVMDYIRGMIEKNGMCTVGDVKGAMDISPDEDDFNLCWNSSVMRCSCQKKSDGVTYLYLPEPRRIDI